MKNFKLLFVISFAAASLMVGVGLIVALLPQRVLALSGSISDVGLVASFFALSYLMVQLPAGYLADRLGVKFFLVVGYLLCSVSGLVFFFAIVPQTIFLGRFIQGAGEAPIWALGPALLSLAYPHAEGKVIGIYNAAIHAGLTLGPLIGIAFFPTGQSNIPFLLFAVLCALGGVITVLFLPKVVANRQLTRRAPRLGELVRVLCLRDPLLTLSGILLYGACYGIFLSVLPASLLLFKQFDSFDVGVFFALFYIAISVSQLIVGPLSDRHGRRVYMIVGLLMAASGIAIFDQFTLPLIYFPLVLTSLGLGVFCVSSMAHLNECVPDPLKGSISGSYYLFWGFGYFLGPLLVGMIANPTNPYVGYYLLAALVGVQALVMILTKNEKG